MRTFPKRIASLSATSRKKLDDSGIMSTTIHYEYSYDVALWLTKCFPQQVEIDWQQYDQPEQLDAVLVHLLRHAEQQTWDDGMVGTQEWVKRAVGNLPVTDLTWLLHQIRNTGSRQPILAALYDSAEVPIRWQLTSPVASKSFCGVKPITPIVKRVRWRKPTHRALPEIVKPCRSIKLLPKQQARQVIDVSLAALAARHREVYAMTYANEEEVYLASVGLGTQIAILGVKPRRRFSLEGNFGYMILSNGVPIGYGGASPLFRQVNTGINILDEYRRGESQFLFIQVLRVLHSLFGCTKFIASPYQFGAENDEALATGAFWFYYKIGFRPAKTNVRQLARKSYTAMRQDRHNRPNRTTMKQLCSCDLTLTTKEYRTSDAFEERWLGTLATAATKRLAEQGKLSRADASRLLASKVATALGVKNMSPWPSSEREAFDNLAPVLAVIPDLADWSKPEKKACIKLIQAKGAKCERPYLLQLAQHQRLRLALATACKNQGD